MSAMRARRATNPYFCGWVDPASGEPLFNRVSVAGHSLGAQYLAHAMPPRRMSTGCTAPALRAGSQAAVTAESSAKPAAISSWSAPQ